MKRNGIVGGAIILVVLLVAGCSLFPDVIEGSWQQASVDGVGAVLVTVVSFFVVHGQRRVRRDL